MLYVGIPYLVKFAEAVQPQGAQIPLKTEPPGGALDTPGAPWNGLEAPENPAYKIYYGITFWVHVVGICGGL